MPVWMQGMARQCKFVLRFLLGLLSLTTIIVLGVVGLVLFSTPVVVLYLAFYKCKNPNLRLLWLQILSWLVALWCAWVAVLIEDLVGVHVRIRGCDIPQNAAYVPNVLVCNHPSEADWALLWLVLLKFGRVGAGHGDFFEIARLAGLRYTLKSSLRKVPIFGGLLKAMGCIFLERSWSEDRDMLSYSITRLLGDQRGTGLPLWLVLFPEGTNYTERKCAAAQGFAERRGLPILDHVLIPRTKGFDAIVHQQRPQLAHDVSADAILREHTCHGGDGPGAPTQWPAAEVRRRGNGEGGAVDGNYHGAPGNRHGAHGQASLADLALASEPVGTASIPSLADHRVLPPGTPPASPFGHASHLDPAPYPPPSSPPASPSPVAQAFLPYACARSHVGAGAHEGGSDHNMGARSHEGVYRHEDMCGYKATCGVREGNLGAAGPAFGAIYDVTFAMDGHGTEYTLPSLLLGTCAPRWVDVLLTRWEVEDTMGPLGLHGPSDHDACGFADKPHAVGDVSANIHHHQGLVSASSPLLANHRHHNVAYGSSSSTSGRSGASSFHSPDTHAIPWGEGEPGQARAGAELPVAWVMDHKWAAGEDPHEWGAAGDERQHQHKPWSRGDDPAMPTGRTTHPHEALVGAHGGRVFAGNSCEREGAAVACRGGDLASGYRHPSPWMTSSSPAAGGGEGGLLGDAGAWVPGLLSAASPAGEICEADDDAGGGGGGGGGGRPHGPGPHADGRGGEGEVDQTAPLLGCDCVQRARGGDKGARGQGSRLCRDGSTGGVDVGAAADLGGGMGGREGGGGASGHCRGVYPFCRHAQQHPSAWLMDRFREKDAFVQAMLERHGGDGEGAGTGGGAGEAAGSLGSGGRPSTLSHKRRRLSGSSQGLNGGSSNSYARSLADTGRNGSEGGNGTGGQNGVLDSHGIGDGVLGSRGGSSSSSKDGEEWAVWADQRSRHKYGIFFFGLFLGTMILLAAVALMATTAGRVYLGVSLVSCLLGPLAFQLHER
eukprot:jgi/Mesvir1/19594/Mv25055-RA.1